MPRIRMKNGAERPASAVPFPVIVLLAAALFLQVAWQALQPRPVARAQALGEPPAQPALRLLALGEPIALAQALTLYVQAHDNQPGISIPFSELDYGRVARWLESILKLDPAGHYPLLLASHVYSQVPDAARQRRMCDFVRVEFGRDPNRRWRWLAHCAVVAKHRIRDARLALSYADAIAREAPAAPSWARHMRVFLLEDLGELEAARVLLGGLLASGEITDPAELRFLARKLKELESGGISSHPSNTRRPDSAAPGKP